MKIGAIDLSAQGLTVIRGGHKGLFDFPAIKENGTDWKDEDYNDVSTRCLDFHYGQRTITLNCIIVGSSWSDLESKINTITTQLSFPDLKMLRCEDVSNRGYMVYLAKSTLANPIKHFRAGKCIAEVDFIFIEPQPYNFQVQWDARTSTKSVSITISKGSKTLNTDSNKQRYITVWWNNTKTEVNLEQTDYTLTASVSGALFPLVVTGEIDDIEAVTVNSAASGVTEAAYFLRNGTLTVS